MAIPLLAPIGAALAKFGLGKAGTAAASRLILPTAAKTAAKAVVGDAVKKNGLRRMAGQALEGYLGEKPTLGNLASNFGFDAAFGVMQGMATPGDLGDKLIAGVSTGVGGALGGVGAVGTARALTGKTPQGFGRQVLEFGGGYGGDMLGQMGGDALMRIKGGGTTPWEKVQQSADQEYRAQLEREMLARMGVGGYNQTDLFLSECISFLPGS